MKVQLSMASPLPFELQWSVAMLIHSTPQLWQT